MMVPRAWWAFSTALIGRAAAAALRIDGHPSFFLLFVFFLIMIICFSFPNKIHRFEKQALSLRHVHQSDSAREVLNTKQNFDLKVVKLAFSSSSSTSGSISSSWMRGEGGREPRCRGGKEGAAVSMNGTKNNSIRITRGKHCCFKTKITQKLTTWWLDSRSR